jgi:hypothetical protein
MNNWYDQAGAAAAVIVWGLQIAMTLALCVYTQVYIFWMQLIDMASSTHKRRFLLLCTLCGWYKGSSSMMTIKMICVHIIHGIIIEISLSYWFRWSLVSDVIGGPSIWTTVHDESIPHSSTQWMTIINIKAPLYIYYHLIPFHYFLSLLLLLYSLIRSKEEENRKFWRQVTPGRKIHLKWRNRKSCV